MKCVQTLWTKDMKPEDLLSLSAGWRSPEYHWMSWALSCLQIKKFFGNVHLVTDENGKYVLSELFRLPFDSISTRLDNEMKPYPESLWAMAKIHSYQSQTEPFLHFDSDFYLWQPVNQKLQRAAVVSQNLEKNLGFYPVALENVNEHLKYIPDICKPEFYKSRPIYACNAGVLGGADLSFIQRYCRYATDFVEKNIGCFDFGTASNMNFIFEQYFLYCLAEQDNVPITFVSDTIQENILYTNYIRFDNRPFIPFIHPVGGYKKYTEICDHTAAQLRMEYPDYYYLILDVLQRSNKLRYIKFFCKESQCREQENLFFSNTEDVYKRTLTALQYLQKNNPDITDADVILIKEKIKERDIASVKTEIKQLRIPAKEKKLWLQLFSFEARKAVLFEAVFIKRKKQRALYEQEVEQYKFIQSLFAGSDTEINCVCIKRNTHLRLLSVSRNWVCKIPELTGQMITDKFTGPEEQPAYMTLVPKISRRDIDEYYLEPIDAMIIGLCSRKTIISAVVQQMKEYFSADEVEADYKSYRQLIVDTMKRLLYLRILVVCP